MLIPTKVENIPLIKNVFLGIFHSYALTIESQSIYLGGKFQKIGDPLPELQKYQVEELSVGPFHNMALVKTQD